MKSVKAFIVAQAVLAVVILGPAPSAAAAQLTEVAKLSAPAGFGSHFVAVSGDTALVGNPSAFIGEARVFVRSVGPGGTVVWTEQAKLTASDGVGGDQFGFAVALDGDTALVGARAKNGFTGAAYVFTRSGTTWTQQAKLTPDSTGLLLFGDTVALSGDTALISVARERVIYVFVRSASGWAKQAKFTSSDGVAGNSLALDGDTALVGAANGAAYVFARSGTAWTQQAKLSPPSGAIAFGISVALSGNWALVGEQVNVGLFTGSAYLFAKSGSEWVQKARLTPSDGVPFMGFGSRVALRGETALVKGHECCASQGVYVFDGLAGLGATATEHFKLVPSDGARLNGSLAIDGRTAVVGSTLAAYVFELPRRPVLIIPGIAGTYADEVSSALLGEPGDLFWLLNRGVPPDLLQIDPLARVYHDLIKTLENVGYKKGKDLFVVNYDWRLAPGPSDGVFNGTITGITAASITDGKLEYAVDYLGVALRKALDAWEKDHPGLPLAAVDVIAHSTGGLVARTYIQSAAYGGTFSLDRKLPRIGNLLMVGVPNRGASKAWNPLHDNWGADKESQAVLSKIINRAYQKVLKGFEIKGPDHVIDLASITDPSTGPDPARFVHQYVPTIRALLATYLFLDCDEGPPIEGVACGAALTHVNGSPDLRNSLVLDLNAGFDSAPAGDRNAFADRARVTVIYGDGNDTPRTVRQRVGPPLLPTPFGQIAPFTDFVANDPDDGQVWYEDVRTDGKGDGTVPLDSSAGQFTGDARVTLVRFAKGVNTAEAADHLGLMYNRDVQKRILQILGAPFTDAKISTDLHGAQAVAALSVIFDPVEGFVVDALGRRLGFSAATGPLTQIPGSVWFGNTDGIGWVFGPIERPLRLELSGLGEDYYVMVSVVDGDETGGLVDQRFLAQGQPRSLSVPVGVTDVTPPAIQLLVEGTPGRDGWYVSDVRVSWEVTDAESPIVSMSGCGPVTVTTDTPGVTLVCEATSDGGTAGRSVRIKRDATPPIIRGLPTAGCALWPPDHRLVQVATVTASDVLSGLAPGAPVVTGASNEPENGLGDGDQAPDIVIAGGAVHVRAERSGRGAGRTYTVEATATDVAGNVARAVRTCVVPHDQGRRASGGR